MMNSYHFIVEDIYSSAFLKNIFCILGPISLKFVPPVPIDASPVLLQVMHWCWAGGKPLAEPIMNQFTETYMRHKTWMNWICLS